MKISYLFKASIGYVGCDREEVVELEYADDLTSEQIDAIVEEAWKEWVWNYIDGTYTLID